MATVQTARARAAKKRTNVLIRIAILAFVVFVVVSMVQTLLELDRQKKRLNAINAQIAAQNQANAAMEEHVDPNGQDAYYESEARKQGLAKPGELVLQEVPA